MTSWDPSAPSQPPAALARSAQQQLSCPASEARAVFWITLLFTFQLSRWLPSGNFHSQPFQLKKYADALPNLKSWSSFTADPAHLPLPPRPAPPLCSAAEESTVGKQAVVFIQLLFISLCRYGSKFRELILNDLASKANPFSKSSQNFSPLTNSEWKPFKRAEWQGIFNIMTLNTSLCSLSVTPVSWRQWYSQRRGWAKESLFSEHSGNHSERGKVLLDL